MKSLFKLLIVGSFVLGASGCTRDYKFQPVDMWNEARFRPYEEVDFFEDQKVARTPPEGTVARGQSRVDEPLYYGTQGGELIEYNPLLERAPLAQGLVNREPSPSVPGTASAAGASVAEGTTAGPLYTTPQQRLAFLQRGQERYNIYCQPCHGLNGAGDGMIVKRGFAKPPSYHIERLQEVPDGYLFDVITNGYGSMYSYASRVPTQDRWAIVAYIRTLQRSQNAEPGDIPAEVREALGENDRIVSPPLRDELRYLGPAAGGSYHGSGAGNVHQETPIEREREQSAQ